MDKCGQTIDFFLSPRRDEPTARKFLQRAIRHYGAPRVVTFDGYRANHLALRDVNVRRQRARLPAIELRNRRYLNHIVEQDHRAVKRPVRPMMGLQAYQAAVATLCGIELAHMLRKRQGPSMWGDLSIAEKFTKLAA